MSPVFAVSFVSGTTEPQSDQMPLDNFNSNSRQTTRRFDNFASGEVDRPQGEPSVSEADGPKAPK
jgi:hypothetical protein